VAFTRFAGVLLLVVAGACGKNATSPTDGGADGMASDEAASDATESGDATGDTLGDTSSAMGQDGVGEASSTACNAISNVATPIPIGISPDAVPTMTGGTIADGTYVETTVTDYGNDIQKTTMTQTTWVINGSTLQWVEWSNELPEARLTMSLTTSDNALTFGLVCPASGGTIAATYTATPTELRYITHNLPFELHVLSKL
jgi:hypothetical protein